MIELSEEQLACEQRVHAFLADPNPPKPYFNVQGLAGCGKSTALAKIARSLGPRAIMGAYTGKAASVLSRKTGLQASTIHGAIYRFEGESWNDLGEHELEFSEKITANAWSRRVFLLDESSMVPDDLARDLLSTGIRVVTAGDPGQLRPVKGSAYFRDPDFTLQEIRRQAWDSPIIRQAHRMRFDGTYGPDGDAFRVERYIGVEDLLAADIVLCWRNATRRNLNALIRAHKGMSLGCAAAGEPVMALKNNHRDAVLNGAIYTLAEPHFPNANSICVKNERGETVDVYGYLEGMDEAPEDGGENWITPFAFAYAATVHKFQGSEADRVILVDEYDRADERREWMYTGITRAAKSIIVQRSW